MPLLFILKGKTNNRNNKKKNRGKDLTLRPRAKAHLARSSLPVVFLLTRRRDRAAVRWAHACHLLLPAPQAPPPLPYLLAWTTPRSHMPLPPPLALLFFLLSG